MLRSIGGALEAVVIVPASGVIHTPLNKYDVSYCYIEFWWRPQALGVFGARWLHLWLSWTNFAKFDRGSNVWPRAVLKKAYRF